jgi:hypothetical protein
VPFRPARTRLRPLATLAAATALGAGALVGAPSAGAASAGDPIIMGAVGANAGEIAAHDRDLGVKTMGLRVFKKWDSKLFGGPHQAAGDQGRALFLSINTDRRNGSSASYRAIASADPGSDLHQDMLSQAAQIKAYGHKVFIIFNHEPEVKFNRHKGDGDDFVAAWRKVVSTYRAAGVKNAEYVWTVSGHSFSRDDKYAAENYYPGDEYVDHIGADVYNWGDCRGGKERWGSMAGLLEGHRRFGAQHPSKGLVVPEWGSVEDRDAPGRKADFIREVRALFKQPGWEQYGAVLTWGGRTDNGSGICQFDYTTSASATDAMRDMANDPAYRGSAADL